MVKPYKSDRLVSVMASAERKKEIEADDSIASVVISSAAAANAVMLGSGYFSPLTGYMKLADALHIAEDLHTSDGLFWPVPIVNRLADVSDITVGDELKLQDPNVEGNPVIAVMKVEAIDTATQEELETIAKSVFGTLDPEHPGVKVFFEQGNNFVSGPIEVLNYSYFEKDFSDTFKTAFQIREEIKNNGWDNVVAFQTRNPMHRAHEELCKIAMERLGCDGVIIHMLLGKLKEGDVPADVRDNAIRTMAKNYFPENSVLISGYGFDMLYAGPREAVLHAIFRQNMGASHFIIGRDHAGVGDYYGPFEAQEIFDHSVPEGTLDIEIFKADHAAYSKALGKVVMFRDAPEDHKMEDFVILSGTKVREMLKDGVAPPEEFSRPEVAEILIEWARSNSK